MEKISERINKIIENESVSVRSFEHKIGASNGLISKSISKGTDINSIWLSKIIESYPNYNAEWLLTGIGDFLKPNDLSHKNFPSNKTACPFCKEKDERIAELKDHISTLKDKISSLDKAAASQNSNYSQSA